MTSLSGLALALVAVAAILVATVAPCLAMDGKTWLEVPEPWRGYYVIGVVDVWLAIKSQSTEAQQAVPNHILSLTDFHYGRVAECLDGESYRQVIGIVEKYMKEHPEGRHHSMASNVWTAVWSVCRK
jgi:hypothetical protein